MPYCAFWEMKAACSFYMLWVQARKRDDSEVHKRVPGQNIITYQVLRKNEKVIGIALTFKHLQQH